MKVAILHDCVVDEESPDQQDVLVQRETVGSALKHLGHEFLPIVFSLDLPNVIRSLEEYAPDVVFNLVESVGGDGRLIHLAPSILGHLGIPYTGCPLDATFLSTDKILAKKHLIAAGLPTPPWLEAETPPTSELTYIVKSSCEDASIGIDDQSVVTGTQKAKEKIREKETVWGGRWFAESYIEGREFNVSILEDQGGPRVLPLAETCFLNFPKDKPKVIDYSAKWDETSFGYQNTPRSFEFPAEDSGLLKSLSELSLRTWALFGCRGYGRVDFRVGTDGTPWILELNVNPCLSPDAGFLIACQQKGLTPESVVSTIISSAMRRFSPNTL